MSRRARIPAQIVFAVATASQSKVNSSRRGKLNHLWFTFDGKVLVRSELSVEELAQAEGDMLVYLGYETKRMKGGKLEPRPPGERQWVMKIKAHDDGRPAGDIEDFIEFIIAVQKGQRG